MRPHFLQSLVRGDAAASVLRNSRHGGLLAGIVEPAFDSVARRRGLLGRDGMPDGSALIIAPCQAIHTFRMRFAIDVLFVDRSGRVLKIAAGVRPGRLAGCLTAFAVLELPAGAAARTDTRVGDVIACTGALTDQAAASAAAAHDH